MMHFSAPSEADCETCSVATSACDACATAYKRKPADMTVRLHIPVGGAPTILKTASGMDVCTGYRRVVLGRRGPYVEFDAAQALVQNFNRPKDFHYYYEEFRTRRDDVKIYKQFHRVNYADYRPGFYYVSPFELKTDYGPVIDPRVTMKKPTVPVQHDLFSEEELLKPLPADDYQAMKLRALGCTRCGLRKACQQVVFGSGNTQRPKLAIVGEAPGEKDDEIGKLFQGPAGDVLDKMMEVMLLKREDVYMCSVVACRPYPARAPFPEEIFACSEWLEGQLRAVQPRIILALGGAAANRLLGNNPPEPAIKLRGTWSTWMGIPLMSTLHPAYLLKNPSDKVKVLSDLQAVARKLAELK